MKPSPAPIPREKLQIWKIFRDVGPEGEEILKSAKLAHVANEKETFVVTLADETYSFLRDDDGVCKITKIPELCQVLVKEFVTGSISLAITEDGRLYSWSNNFTSGAEIDPNLKAQLGRDPVSNLATDPNFIGHPQTVKYSRGEKIVQVALSDLEQGRAVALTVGGDVYQWGCGMDSPLISNAKFDREEVISVACGLDGMTFALSEDGEIFQWIFGTDLITKSDICSTPVKKIAATKTYVHALTAEGTIYVCRTGPERSPVWTPLPKRQNLQDIATCSTENLVVIEQKNGPIGCWNMMTSAKLSSPVKPGSLDELFGDLCQKSYRTIGMPNPIMTPVQKNTVAQEIASLWRTKNDADVAFSVEGKTITAHKFILKLRSDFFAKMFSNEWKKTSAKSAIEIRDTKYVTFEALLFYLYHDKVSFSEYEDIFDLMKLADSYYSTSIARDCEKILIRGINAENVFFLVRNASSANALNLERKVLQYIVDERTVMKNFSTDELIELIGQEAFNKVAMALLRR